MVNETEFELREELDLVEADLTTDVVLKSDVLFISILFLVDPVGPETFGVTVAFNFTVFDVLRTLSADDCFFNSEFWVSSAGPSPD